MSQRYNLSLGFLLRSLPLPCLGCSIFRSQVLITPMSPHSQVWAVNSLLKRLARDGLRVKHPELLAVLHFPCCHLSRAFRPSRTSHLCLWPHGNQTGRKIHVRVSWLKRSINHSPSFYRRDIWGHERSIWFPHN